MLDAITPFQPRLHLETAPNIGGVQPGRKLSCNWLCMQAVMLGAAETEQLAVVVGGRVLAASIQVQPVTLATLAAAAARRRGTQAAVTPSARHCSASWLSALEQAAAQPRIAVSVTTT